MFVRELFIFDTRPPRSRLRSWLYWHNPNRLHRMRHLANTYTRSPDTPRQPKRGAP